MMYEARRDPFDVLEEMMTKIKQEGSLSRSDIISKTNFSWDRGMTYINKMLKRGFIEETSNNGQGKHTTKAHYKLTVIGTQALEFIRGFNN